jgi:multifunctional beta-oxidation protein
VGLEKTKQQMLEVVIVFLALTSALLLLEKLVHDIQKLGGKAVYNGDSVEEGDVIVETALKHFNRCDILINNAGNLRDKSFAKMTLADWQSVINVHLNGTFRLCHAVWPVMQQQNSGRIINIGSGAGLYGNFGQANYSSAKMGILGLTQTLAKEGVSICCFHLSGFLSFKSSS